MIVPKRDLTLRFSLTHTVSRGHLGAHLQPARGIWTRAPDLHPPGLRCKPRLQASHAKNPTTAGTQNEQGNGSGFTCSQPRADGPQEQGPHPPGSKFEPAPGPPHAGVPTTLSRSPWDLPQEAANLALPVSCRTCTQAVGVGAGKHGFVGCKSSISC